MAEAFRKTIFVASRKWSAARGNVYYFYEYNIVAFVAKRILPPFVGIVVLSGISMKIVILRALVTPR